MEEINFEQAKDTENQKRKTKTLSIIGIIFSGIAFACFLFVFIDILPLGFSIFFYYPLIWYALLISSGVFAIPGLILCLIVIRKKRSTIALIGIILACFPIIYALYYGFAFLIDFIVHGV